MYFSILNWNTVDVAPCSNSLFFCLIGIEEISKASTAVSNNFIFGQVV